MKQALLLLLLFGCAFESQKLVDKSLRQGFEKKIYSTKNFDIFTLQKIQNSKDDLYIFIEGDGFAYADEDSPALDPTPRHSLLLDLILKEKAKNILYIARPCQFVMTKNCEEKYWTSNRFCAAAVEAIAEVIKNFSQQKHVLIGYSGGAAIINHLPHDNTKKIITIAGNLDLEEFVAFHKISDLKEEKINYQKLAQIPQLHLIGSRDDVIPINIFYAYEKKLPTKNNVRIKIIKGANHYDGWSEIKLD